MIKAPHFSTKRFKNYAKNKVNFLLNYFLWKKEN